MNEAIQSEVSKMKGIYGFLATAVSDFTYGGKVTLNLMGPPVSGDGVPNTSNIVNKEKDEIKVNRYHHKNQVTLHVPRYMADEQPCGCKKCDPDYGGSAGQKFFVVSLTENFDADKLIIVARKDD